MTAARVAIGAAIGLGVAVAAWVVAIVVLEAARTRGMPLPSDLTLARLELVTFVGAPIVGAWFAWVRR